MWLLLIACVTVSAWTSCGAGQPAEQQPLYQPSPPAVGQLETYHDAKEYCETEDFDPSCGEDEVIVMTKAEYGRMDFGRCVKVTYGYLGCSAHVLPALDRLCSGRRSCSVRLPDQSLDAATNPCPDEFKTFLNASYMCVKVQTKPCRRCFKLHYAHVRVERAYIASSVTSHNCGTITCPWRIELQPGQRVNITLFDFALAPKRKDVCFRYAVIKETGGPPRGTPLCGGRHREKHVYTSIGHLVEIHIVSPEVYNNSHFVLYYQAIGCPDITRPKNSWMRKEKGQIVVGCDTTHATWTLKCEDTKWHGEIGSCPQVHTSRDHQKGKVVSLPLGVLVAIVIGIALVIGVLILTVGIVCLKRQQQQYDTRQRQGTALYFRAPQEADLQEEAAAETCTLPLKETCPAGSSGKQHRRHGRTSTTQQQQQQLLQQRENLYARRMESRPLPSLPNLAAETDESLDCRLKVQVHRTNSGRKPGTRTGPGPGPGQSGSRDCPDPQYFELDPDELKASGCRAHARHAARAANARASSPTRRKGGGGHRQKSPEEENAENCDKEVHHNNSCSEIPLRLIRDSARPPVPRAEPAPANNYSWP